MVLSERIIFATLTALFALWPNQAGRETGWLTVGHEKIKVEIADSPNERRQGLSGRAFLPAETGMLFIFDRAEKPAFWMKEMKFPLDIIWIGPDQTVVGWENDVKPQTYPQTFSPPAPVKWVLEINAAHPLTDKLQIGERVNWQISSSTD